MERIYQKGMAAATGFSEAEPAREATRTHLASLRGTLPLAISNRETGRHPG